MLRARTRLGRGLGILFKSLLCFALCHAAAADETSEPSVELEPVGVEAGDAVVRSLSFDRVLELALGQNLDLELARAEEELARARSRGAASKLVPSLEFGAGTRNTDGRVQGSFGELRDTDFDTKTATAAVSYRVNLGARILDTLAARKELDAAVYGVLNTRQKLLLRVTELFNDLALARVGFQTAKQRAGDSEQFLRIASARARAGIGLGSDVARAEAKLATDRQDRVQAREIWETTSVRLAVVLRLDPGVFLAPAQERLVPLELAPAMAGAEAERNARQRPDVEASRRRMDAAAKRFSSAWWEFAGPELSAELRETYIGESVDDTGDRRNMGLFLGWTLSLNKLATILERRAERTTAHLVALRKEDQAAGEAHRALRTLRGASERLPLARNGLDAAQQNHRISLAQFKSGTAIALEVFDATDRLASAQLDLARSIVDYNLSQVRLMAATGVLQLDLLRSADQAGP